MENILDNLSPEEVAALLSVNYTNENTFNFVKEFYLSNQKV